MWPIHSCYTVQVLLNEWAEYFLFIFYVLLFIKQILLFISLFSVLHRMQTN